MTEMTARAEAQSALAQSKIERRASEQINDLTLKLLERMITMSQVVTDAANRIAQSGQAAAAVINQLISANTDLTDRNSALTAKVADLQANQADPNEAASDQAAADRIAAAADALDAAVSSAQPAQGGAPVEADPSSPAATEEPAPAETFS
jgi:hypothetical protein